MFVFSPLAIKIICRKVARKSSRLKNLHTICLDVPGTVSKKLESSFYLHHKNGYSFKRCISTSVYLHESVKKKDKAEKVLSQEDDEGKHLVQQTNLGDITVKTETNENKEVTKVTIEKLKKENNTEQKPAPPPGKHCDISVYCKKLSEPSLQRTR